MPDDELRDKMVRIIALWEAQQEAQKSRFAWLSANWRDVLIVLTIAFGVLAGSVDVSQLIGVTP